MAGYKALHNSAGPAGIDMPMKSKTQKELAAENDDLRARLEEAEETLRAIRSGEVDALIVSGADGDLIFTLKEVEAALQESEEKFRMLVERLPSIVYMSVVGTAGSTFYISPQVRSHLGYSQEQWLADPQFWSKILHPEDSERVMAKAVEADRANGPFNMEYRVIASDGRMVWVHDQATPVNNLQSQPKFRQGIMLDITARKQIEEALYESEMRYRSIFENSQDAILLTAPDGSILDVNPATSRMFGRTEEDIKHSGRNALVDLSDPRLAAALEERARTGKVMSEITMVRADGSKFATDVTSTAFADAQGQMRTSMIIRDITDRKQAEQVLRESEKRFRALVENNSAAITMLDAKGMAIYDSPAAPGMLGYGPEEWIGQDVFTLVHPDDLPEVKKLFARLAKTPGARVNSTFRLNHKSGAWLWLEMVATNLLAEPGVNAVVLNYRDVTERIQADEALRESNERFRQVWETSSDALALSDSEGIVLSANPAYFHLYGYTAEQVIGNSFAIIFPEENRAGAVEQYKLVFDSEAILPTFESGITRADGGERIVETHVVFLGTAGRHTAMLSNIRDITERKQANDALRREKERAQQYLDIAGVMFLVLDADRKVVLINKRGCEILEYTEQEIVGRDWFDFLPPAVRDGAGNGFDQFMAGELQHLEYYENPVLTKSGQERLVAWHNSTLNDEAGRIIGMVSSGEDITQRNQIEQALAESEQHYRQIIETAGEGIWTIDTANRTTLVNQHLADMLGYTVKEMIGKSVYDFMDDDGKAIAAKSIENRRQGINEQLDFKYIHKDGSTVWAIIETSTLLDRNQQYTGALAMLTNITERRHAQDEIRQRLGELELLYQSGLSFSQLTNSKAIAQKIIDLLDQKMSWHHTAVRLYHPQSETLELLVFNQPNLDSWEERSAAEALLKTVQRPDQGLTGWVVQHGQALRSNDLKNDPRYLETSPGLHSGLYVPIKISERVIGVISVESEQAQAFSDSDERLAITLAAQAAVAIDKALLLRDLKRSNLELSLAYDATIEGWSGALDLRDKETEGHSQRVTEIALRLAESMGIHGEELVHIRHGALLHDIGKMGVPDQILFKPGKLDDEEWKVMRKHPEFAYKLLSPIAYLKPALDIPYCHHEKWDGTGYPRGLKGKEIPLAARLFAVVDVWDALRSDRPYRPAWTEDKVLAHILGESGTHFDPRVVDAFLKAMEKPVREP
jgi:PAS domain S-box-containing protein